MVTLVPGEPQAGKRFQRHGRRSRHETVRPRSALARERGGRPAARYQSGWTEQVIETARPGAGCTCALLGAQGGASDRGGFRCTPLGTTPAPRERWKGPRAGPRGGMWYRASISGSLSGRAHAMVTSVHVLRDVALGTSNRTDAHHTQVAVQPGILAQCESISLFTSDSSKSWPRPVHVSHAWPRRPSAGCHRAVGRF